jgi:hypothetical protein
VRLNLEGLPSEVAKRTIEEQLLEDLDKRNHTAQARTILHPTKGSLPKSRDGIPLRPCLDKEGLKWIEVYFRD